MDSEIHEIINRETRAWDEQDIDLLMSIFHPDAVWPWPPTAKDHDPLKWELVLGRFNYERWSSGWVKLFNSHELIHNNRETKRIQVSKERDGAIAVVDIDTLWRDKKTNLDMSWKGRTCKVYTHMPDGWKFIFQTGVLNYDN